MRNTLKRILVLMLVVSLVGTLFAGCKKKEEAPKAPKPIVQVPDEPVIEEPAEPVPTPIPENENLLTGIGDLTEDAIGKRPVAVMVNNVADALPQYGISQADVIFEIPVEGNLTRMMALYGDYTQVPKICPIRSCRYYYPALALGFDAYYVHWGCDQTILNYLYSLDIDRFDGMANRYGMFGRDQSRRNQGYALEHTGYFDGTKFAKAMKKNDVRTDLKKKKKETAFSFCGMDELVTPTGKSCSKVHIDFGPCTSTLKYNEEQNVYIKYMNGNPHKDAKTKKKLKFTNVLILETTIYTRDQKGHKYVDWEGGKKAVGYYISNGKKQKITWSKKSEGSYLKFYDKNGDELVINRGKTYLAFVSPGMESFTE